jgi:hypothetical protein
LTSKVKRPTHPSLQREFFPHGTRSALQEIQFYVVCAEEKICGDRGQVINQPVGLDVPYACAQMEEIYLSQKIIRKGMYV